MCHVPKPSIRPYHEVLLTSTWFTPVLPTSQASASAPGCIKSLQNGPSQLGNTQKGRPMTPPQPSSYPRAALRSSESQWPASSCEPARTHPLRRLRKHRKSMNPCRAKLLKSSKSSSDLYLGVSSSNHRRPSKKAWRTTEIDQSASKMEPTARPGRMRCIVVMARRSSGTSNTLKSFLLSKNSFRSSRQRSRVKPKD